MILKLYMINFNIINNYYIKFIFHIFLIFISSNIFKLNKIEYNKNSKVN